MTVKRNVWSSILTTLLIVAIMLAWAARDIIVDFVTQNPRPGIYTQSQIDHALATDLRETNADRILVHHFIIKNMKDRGDSPWVSTVDVQTAPGVAIETVQLLRESPRDFVGEVERRMMVDPHHPNCGHLKTSELSAGEYRTSLIEVGAAEQYFCPVEDIEGNVIGFLVVSYLTETKAHPPEQAIYQILSDTGSRLGGYLPKQGPSWFDPLFKS